MAFNMQIRNKMSEKLEDEFNKPVESIMRCEDFKSNFARRLSNRYTSRSSVSQPKQDTGLRLRPSENSDSRNVSHNAPERIKQNFQLSKIEKKEQNGEAVKPPDKAPTMNCNKKSTEETVLNMEVETLRWQLSQAPKRIKQNFQLSKIANKEQNGEAVKPPDKAPTMNSHNKSTEEIVLNMEVETLRWQLSQTEANRQMHIALLKQIVSFLNRVKDHIKQQNNEKGIRKDILPARLLPRSFNMADLPRSHSVVHVNKGLEYTHSTSKKICSRKISKSISNVNGLKDYNNMWSQLKPPFEPEKETNQKITEEMSRLITLANTVLSTKIPDLAYSCNETESNLSPLTDCNTDSIIIESNLNVTALRQIKEDTINIFKENDKFMPVKEQNNDSKLSLSPLSGLEMEKSLIDIKPHKEKQNDYAIEGQSVVLEDKNTTSSPEKRNDMCSSFIEDESGFSSMSSFQEIGIPIISIIPPSPSKEMGFLEEIPDLLDDVEKWKSDTIELEKQTMKVFWV